MSLLFVLVNFFNVVVHESHCRRKWIINAIVSYVFCLFGTPTHDMIGVQLRWNSTQSYLVKNPIYVLCV